jgi:hypothetical protein
MNKGYLKNVINESYVRGKVNSAPRVLFIDLYTGKSEDISADEIPDATEGLRPVKGQNGVITYKGEESMVIVIK